MGPGDAASSMTLVARLYPASCFATPWLWDFRGRRKASAPCPAPSILKNENMSDQLLTNCRGFFIRELQTAFYFIVAVTSVLSPRSCSTVCIMRHSLSAVGLSVIC
jgi:hypothetical protein